MTISVLIADDQALVRAGLQLVLADAPDITVVGEATDGLGAVGAATRLRPDVVMMDVRMPRLDGVEATRRIRALPEPRRPAVLVLTTFDTDDHLFGALEAGATAFVLKHDDADTLLMAVRCVARGEGFVSPGPTLRLMAAAGRRTDPVERRLLDELTPRELGVLAMIGQGLTNTQIAHRLAIQDSTVKTHVQRVLAKLRVTSRVQAALLAARSGLGDDVDAHGRRLPGAE